jgi:hypothetical protein
MLEVIPEQFAPDGAQGLLGRGELGQHVGAGALVVDHRVQAADLALGAPEALEDGLLGAGVFEGASGRGRLVVIGMWDLGSRHIPS